MADSNRMAIRLKEQASFDTVASGNYETLRFANESLIQATDSANSAEINSDRQQELPIRTNISAAGDINGELSYGAHHTILQAAMELQAYTAAVTVGPLTTISLESIATSASSYAKILDSANGLGGFTANEWVRVEGATGTNNGKIGKIQSVAAGELEIKGIDFTDEAAGASITIHQGESGVNGTFKRAFTIEKELTDLSNVFHRILNATVDTFTIQTAVNAILTTTSTWLGTSVTKQTSSSAGTPTAAPTNRVMNAIDNVKAVIAGVDSYDITSLSIALANNLRQRPQVARLGTLEPGRGFFNLTGSIDAYYLDQSAFDDYLSWTSTSLAQIFEDQLQSGNSFPNNEVFDMPSVQFTSAQPVNTGGNTDIALPMDYVAGKDATEGIMLRHVRFPAS